MEVVVLAGLPGTGKSTIAAALAARGAHVFDRDRVREALFGPSAVAHGAEQDGFVARTILAAVGELTRAGFERLVILDGRTYARASDVEEASSALRAIAVEPRFVECVCDPRVARERLRSDLAAARHPARNRRAALHDEIAARAEPLRVERLVVDTERATPEALVEAILARWPAVAGTLGRGGDVV